MFAAWTMMQGGIAHGDHEVAVAVGVVLQELLHHGVKLQC